MPRPLLAVALVATLAGCKKAGPAEPSEADAKEAYVAYKKLAERARSGHRIWKVAQENRLSKEESIRVVTDEKLNKEIREMHKEAVEMEAESLKEYETRQQRAKEMEAKWEKAWARLGYSLEPLIE